MPRKKNSSTGGQADVRAAVREWLQARVDLYGHVPSNPYVGKLAALDAGKTVSVNSTDLHGTGAAFERHGRYLLRPDGSVTEDTSAIDR